MNGPINMRRRLNQNIICFVNENLIDVKQNFSILAFIYIILGYGKFYSFINFNKFVFGINYVYSR